MRVEPAVRDQADDGGQDTADFDELIANSMRRSPSRACAGTCSRRASLPGGTGPPAAARTPRTCPSRQVSPRTVGKTYTAPDGKTFRPSMFVTLTCPSYGRVDHQGVPVDPAGTTTTRPRGTR